MFSISKYTNNFQLLADSDDFDTLGTKKTAQKSRFLIVL